MVGGLLVFLNPKGPSLLAQPQASALPPSPVVFSRTEKLDPPITCVPLAEGLLWDRPVWISPIKPRPIRASLVTSVLPSVTDLGKA